MTIYVVVVSHRHGEDVYVALTEAECYERLAEYVLEWWQDEMPDPVPELPDNNEELVRLYFERVPDEWFVVQEAELDLSK